MNEVKRNFFKKNNGKKEEKDGHGEIKTKQIQKMKREKMQGSEERWKKENKKNNNGKMQRNEKG